MNWQQAVIRFDYVERQCAEARVVMEEANEEKKNDGRLTGTDSERKMRRRLHTEENSSCRRCVFRGVAALPESEMVIARGNRVPEDFDGIVFDIGRGRYDHHQKDSRVRENGVPYAAFGLLWEELGEAILGEEPGSGI